MKVDIIIPTYKPGKKFIRLLKMLHKQTVKVNKFIVINTNEKYFIKLTQENDFLEQYKDVVIRHISEYEFDHGGTRKMAVSMSDADYFVCMTDDAVPMDKYLLENLLEPLVEEKAAISYARQCVGKKSSDIERFSRKFNYPSKSFYKSKEDLSKMGIKTFFCSNVCAAYDRKVYDSLGGFVKHTIFNEDMIFAAAAVEAGYSIYYSSEAKVRHSHSYNNLQQFKRNFDLGVSQAKFPEVFDKVSSTGEGKKLVKETASYLRKKGKGKRIIDLYITSAFKYAGYLLGKNYKRIPRKLRLKCTMNKMYWLKDDH